MRRPPPITPSAITRDLAALGVTEGDVLLVHTSLSALSGPGSMVVGGATGVVTALRRAVGPRGTLVAPTFSADCSDPVEWTNPPVPEAWWPALRDEMPGWRPDAWPSFRVGVVPELLRTLDGARRSLHPQTSFVALGPEADAIVADHPLTDSLGPTGPLGHLRRLGARVLLLGCGFSSCTAFHLAEHESARPPRRIERRAPLERDGARAWVRWTEPDYDSRRFPDIGRAFQRERTCRRGEVGRARATLFELAEGVAFAVRWMNGEVAREE
ncbi:MAG: AAC(3) family N-acetyltransferase [Myxococcota bacterium]|nr:AAC(3) family N-acetyltransferase [Myxococcota bacterium]